jgi:multisubunit Na+/H+ antiporter MnhF subunit
MLGFVIAALAMMLAALPSAAVLVRGSAMEAAVAYEAISAVVVMVLVLLAEGFRRTGEFELAIVLAVLMFGSGMVFARFLGRGL